MDVAASDAARAEILGAALLERGRLCLLSGRRVRERT